MAFRKRIFQTVYPLPVWSNGKLPCKFVETGTSFLLENIEQFRTCFKLNAVTLKCS